MVVDTGRERTRDAEIDRLFHALADRTRRDIIVRAVSGELSVSALARNYDMSTTAVQKHVSVLETAGLVTRRRRGREQLVTPDPRALQSVRHALDQIETQWRQRLEQFGEVLADLPPGDDDEDH